MKDDEETKEEEVVEMITNVVSLKTNWKRFIFRIPNYPS